MPASSTITLGTDEVTVALPVDARPFVTVALTPNANETRKNYATRLNQVFASLPYSTDINKKLGVNYLIELRPADATLYEKYVNDEWVVDGADFHADCVTYVQS